MVWGFVPGPYQATHSTPGTLAALGMHFTHALTFFSIPLKRQPPKVPGLHPAMAYSKI